MVFVFYFSFVLDSTVLQYSKNTVSRPVNTHLIVKQMTNVVRVRKPNTDVSRSQSRDHLQNLKVIVCLFIFIWTWNKKTGLPLVLQNWLHADGSWVED